METLLSIAKLDEDGARDYLESVRWANGRVCPHCGESERTNVLNGVKDKKGQLRRGLYKCYQCRKQFTVTTGTVMHGSHLSLQQWIVGFYLVSCGKKGVAALELKRALGIGSRVCAWHLGQRIREAMSDDPLLAKMTGVIEADETYIGGKSRKMISGRGSERKTPVLAVIQRDGSAIARPLDRVTADNLKGAIREVADSSATIYTDEFTSYKGIGREFEGGHHTVCHSAGEYSRDGVHVNNCEAFFALMKRGVHGTFHSVSKKHLARYCNEFAFRWNSRKVSDTERAEYMIANMAGRRLPYKNLIGKM